MAKAQAKPEKKKPPRLLVNECEPVECACLRSKLEYCWQYLHLQGLLDTSEVNRIQAAIEERAKRECPPPEQATLFGEPV